VGQGEEVVVVVVEAEAEAEAEVEVGWLPMAVCLLLALPVVASAIRG
jgi:hypothetical protein